MSILLVEDDARIAAFITKGLRAHGYSVHHAATGAEGVARGLTRLHELVILDLRLPDIHGLEIVRELRAAAVRVPIIILSASSDVPDRVAGLDCGADDYLGKPFAFDELLARIRVQLRPAGAAESDLLTGCGVDLDLTRHRVSCDGRDVLLTARQFALLEMFMRHPGQVLTRGQILSSVWGVDFQPATNVVDVFVRHLRVRLGKNVFETVRGAGYRFVDSPAEQRRVS